MTWKGLSYYWPFVRAIHRSPEDSPHHSSVMRNFDVSFDVLPNVLLNKQRGENEKVNWDSWRSFEYYNSEFVVFRKCPITRRCLWRVPRGLMCSKANLVRDSWACRGPGLLSDIHAKIHVSWRKNFNMASEWLAAVLLEDLCQLTWTLIWKFLSNPGLTKLGTSWLQSFFCNHMQKSWRKCLLIPP